YTGSNNTLIANNVVFGNGDHGIDNYSSTGQRIISNSVYDNVTAGINLEVSSTGGTLANNIAVDNGIDSPRTKGNIRVDSASTSGVTLDYDLVHLRTAATMMVWGNTSYATLSAFVSGTGREVHGVQANPLWVDAAGDDFHLRPGSPAIDSANSGVSGEQAADVEDNPRVNDPATANTGVGPRPYDDRGAYE